MKIKIKKSILKQIVQQIIKQDKKPAPKGTNILKVLHARRQAGKQGRSWTELHNAIEQRSRQSDWSSQNRGNNISAINRCAGRDNGYTEQGDPEQSPYQNQPLIKKNELDNYVITQRGIVKMRQLQKELQGSDKSDSDKNQK